MAIIKFPEFTPKAAAFWAKIDMQHRALILDNVVCGHCRCVVEIIDYSGSIVSGDLLLKGKCARCGHDVARLVEGS